MSTNFDYNQACQAVDVIETNTNKVVPEAFDGAATFMNKERAESGSTLTDELFNCYIQTQEEYNTKVVPAIKVLLNNTIASGEMAKKMEAFQADKIAETEKKDAQQIDLDALKGCGL